MADDSPQVLSLILGRIDAVAEEIKGLRAELREDLAAAARRVDSLEMRLLVLEKDAAALKVKVAMFGGGAGILGSALMIVAKNLLGH